MDLLKGRLLKSGIAAKPFNTDVLLNLAVQTTDALQTSRAYEPWSDRSACPLVGANLDSLEASKGTPFSILRDHRSGWLVGKGK